uniref:uncharacterized protein LOC122578998 n=1 Tax=Erigeron canadensis TaxID=72917 RepID=UPI001CB9BF40|nr:uncharacterized protein LOC122578998 [Erigeron canadensis]
MESNVCDVNRLDSDVLLPPRKRLLAGLKKQNGDVNGNGNGNVNGYGNGNGNGNSVLDELDSRISYLLKAHLSNDNPSEEEIVAASRAAAEVAVKVALTARAAAQEKAVIAAKAMAAAKKALEVVATLDGDQAVGGSVEERMRKNKSIKQVELQVLYNNKTPKLDSNGKANDEEVARKLHQAINSSPRITKGGVPSDVKSPKQKKLKSSIFFGNDRISNGSIPGVKISPSSNDKEVENTTKLIIENEPKAKSGDEDITTLGRKRGRMKQKKLPLSICHDRDQATLKEDGSLRSPLSAGPSANSVERGTLWKCQSFKAPACVKQNKVMQS